MTCHEEEGIIMHLTKSTSISDYTTRPFYIVRQSFVDKFRVSELRSTNSKDELWDQETLHHDYMGSADQRYRQNQNNSVLVSRCVLQLTARNLFHDLVSPFLYIRCTKNLSRCSGRKMRVMIYGQYCKSTLSEKPTLNNFEICKIKFKKNCHFYFLALLSN